MTAELAPFFRLNAFERIASTSDCAKLLAEEGAPEGTLVLAAEQSAGRGRERRRWISPRGNLHASLVLRPRVTARAAAQLGFAAALAVAEAASSFLPHAAITLKWPNDVLAEGAKLAGMLLESRARGEAAVDWLVIGVGVNLAHHPEGLEYPATSLAALGAAVAPDTFLPILAARLLAQYEAWQCHGFAPVRAAWLARAHALGGAIRVRLGGGEEHGRFAGLDEDGRLLFDAPGGRKIIAAADVFPAEP